MLFSWGNQEGGETVRLTEKQKRFVDYFIETGNASEAARKAGYSAKYAAQNTDKLLKNTNIATAIEARLKQLESERIADATEVLQFLTAAMRGEIREDVVVTEMICDGVSEARIMDKQLSAKDRVKAAELLGKRYGLQTDKMQIELTPIVIRGDDQLED